MTALEQLISYVESILNTGLRGDFVIGAELLPTERNFKNAMLKAQPNDTERQFVDGRRRFTKYKTLYLKLNFTGEQDRLENEALLTEVQDIIYRKNRRYELPPNEGRKWVSLECSGSPYTIHIDENSNTAIYQITLKIIYEEE
jgi:hypothetical protein